MYPTVFWGNLLRELRENHYMLQKEVATLLHISRQSYSNIEVGKTKPTPEQLATLSYIYEVNLLDYVDKCLPASYLAERYAFRADQTRKIAEILLIQEEMEKYGTERPKEKSMRETEPYEDETTTRPESKNHNAPFPADPDEKVSSDTSPESYLPKPRKRRKRKTEEDNASALKKELLRRRNTRKKAPQFHNTSGMSDVDLLKSKRHIEDVLARGDHTFPGFSEDYSPEDPDLMVIPPEDSDLIDIPPENPDLMDIFPGNPELMDISPENPTPDSGDTAQTKKRSPRKGRTPKKNTKKNTTGRTRTTRKASNPSTKKNSAKTNTEKANASKPSSGKTYAKANASKSTSGKTYAKANAPKSASGKKKKPTSRK